MAAVLALAASVVAPAVQSGWHARSVRQGTRTLAGVMRGLRERALRQGTELQLVLEPDGQTFRWSGGGPAELPGSAMITGTRGGWRDDSGELRIIFYPSGATNGAAVIVSGPDERGLRFAIEVDPLLGSVVVRDAT